VDILAKNVVLDKHGSDLAAYGISRRCRAQQIWTTFEITAMLLLTAKSVGACKGNFGHFRLLEQDVNDCTLLARYDFLFEFHSDLQNLQVKLLSYVQQNHKKKKVAGYIQSCYLYMWLTILSSALHSVKSYMKMRKSCFRLYCQLHHNLTSN